MTRVVLLTEIPAPYRIPLFNALAERVELRVVFLRERNPERPYDLHREEWRFAYEILSGRDVTIGRRWLVVNRGAGRALRDADAVVLGGWNQPAFWAALLRARRRRTPVLTWVESTAQDTRTAPLAPLKRLLLRRSAAVLVPGSDSAELVRALGVDAGRVVTTPNAVDTALFARAAEERRPAPRCRFLFVGRLASEKGVDLLLRALEGVDAELVVAGTGPEEARLRSLAPAGVRFLGHVDRDALVDVYAQADALVLPSRSEPWGMTLNEGAAAGLPLVASDAAGATAALVEEGANGFRVPAGDVGALREALRTLAEDPDLRARMGARSRELAERHSPERWAAAVAEAVTTLRRR
jgi:glycosyltransferase involved in cell wall biosynthesis